MAMEKITGIYKVSIRTINRVLKNSGSYLE